MKITKEMGRACLKVLAADEAMTQREVNLAVDALCEAGVEWLLARKFGTNADADTALAMCAAIAGVKP